MRTIEANIEAIQALTERQQGYISGLFDGEGSATIHDKKRVGSPTFRVTITQNRPAVLHWLQGLFGGGIYNYDYVSNTPIGKKYKQGSFYWTLNGLYPPHHFLKFVLPSLIVKRAEIELLLHFMDVCCDMSLHERAAIYEQFSALKREGAAQLLTVEQATAYDQAKAYRVARRAKIVAIRTGTDNE